MEQTVAGGAYSKTMPGSLVPVEVLPLTGAVVAAVPRVMPPPVVYDTELLTRFRVETAPPELAGGLSVAAGAGGLVVAAAVATGGLVVAAVTGGGLVVATTGGGLVVTGAAVALAVGVTVSLDVVTVDVTPPVTPPRSTVGRAVVVTGSGLAARVVSVVTEGRGSTSEADTGAAGSRGGRAVASGTAGVLDKGVAGVESPVVDVSRAGRAVTMLVVVSLLDVSLLDVTVLVVVSLLVEVRVRVGVLLAEDEVSAPVSTTQ